MSKTPIAPGIYDTITDLSTYVEGVPSTIGLICFVSDKGIDNKMIYTTSKQDLINNYGKPNYDKFGAYAEGLETAYQFINQSPSMYTMRVLPDDARYAHLAVTWQPNETSTDPDDVGKLWWAVGYDALGISSDSQIEAFLETACGAGASNSDPSETPYIASEIGCVSSAVDPGLGHGSVLTDTGELEPGYGMLVFYPKGRGEYYNNFKIKLIKVVNSDWIYELQTYIKNEVSQQWELAESLHVSFKQDLTDDDGENLFVEDVLSTYSKYINCKVNDTYSFDKWISKITQSMIVTNTNISSATVTPDYTVNHIVSSNDEDLSAYETLGNTIYISSGVTTGTLSSGKGTIYVYGTLPDTSNGWKAQDPPVQPANNSIILDSSSSNYYKVTDSSNGTIILYTAPTVDPVYISVKEILQEDSPNTTGLTSSDLFFVTESVMGDLYSDDYIGNIVYYDTNISSWAVSSTPIYGDIIKDANNNFYIYLGGGYITEFDPFAYPFLVPLASDDDINNRKFYDGSSGTLLTAISINNSVADTCLISAYSGDTDVNVIDRDNYYFTLVYDAGYPSPVKTAIVNLAKNQRRDCVAILSNSKTASTFNNEIQIRRTKNTFNTFYAALYCVGTKVYDKFSSKSRWVNPTYHLAQIIPYNDEVASLYYSPAGYNRGVLQGVEDMRYNPIIESQLEQLYLNQLNPLVLSDGTYLVYGELTTQRKPSALQSLKIVRTVLYIDTALRKYCKYYLWEQNDDITWKQVERDVVQFLESVKHDRGLYDYECEVSATKYEIKRKMFHVNITLNPTRTTEKIMLNFFIK